MSKSRKEKDQGQVEKVAKNLKHRSSVRAVSGKVTKKLRRLFGAR